MQRQLRANKYILNNFIYTCDAFNRSQAAISSLEGALFQSNSVQGYVSANNSALQEYSISSAR